MRNFALPRKSSPTLPNLARKAPTTASGPRARRSRDGSGAGAGSGAPAGSAAPAGGSHWLWRSMRAVWHQPDSRPVQGTWSRRRTSSGSLTNPGSPDRFGRCRSDPGPRVAPRAQPPSRRRRAPPPRDAEPGRHRPRDRALADHDLHTGGRSEEQGFVIERVGGRRRAPRVQGRPPILLQLDPSAGIAAGIDFDHRHVRVAISDLSRAVIAEAGIEIDVDNDAPRRSTSPPTGPRRARRPGVERSACSASASRSPGPSTRSRARSTRLVDPARLERASTSRPSCAPPRRAGAPRQRRQPRRARRGHARRRPQRRAPRSTSRCPRASAPG